MNSSKSTLPFAWLSNEAKVLGFVLGSLLASESAIRSMESRLSLDIVHLQGFDKTVARLVSQRDENTCKVLFVGNSLLREGIQVEALRNAATKQLGGPVVVERIHPDNTAFAEWYYAIDRYVLTSHRPVPDAIVIVFQGVHLRDAASRHINELGRYYCGPNQLADLATFDLLSLEQWLQYCICSLSCSLSNHERVERRVLERVIPNYRSGIQELNRRGQCEVSRTEKPASYLRLSNMIHVLQSRQIGVVLVEIPIQDSSSIDPELEKLASENNVLLVKTSHVSLYTRDDFTDGLHMNAVAAERYSQELGKIIDWPSLFLRSSTPK